MIGVKRRAIRKEGRLWKLEAFGGKCYILRHLLVMRYAGAK